MQVFRGIVVVATVVVAVVVVGGWALGSTWRVERAVVVDATPAQVHAVVTDLHAWRRWAAGPAGNDPACAWAVDGAAGTAGASISWRGPPCGAGRVVLVDASPARGAWFDDHMGLAHDGDAQPPVKTGSERLTYRTEAGRTRVTWAQEGELDVIAGGWLVGRLEERLGDHMDEGLRRLAALVIERVAASTAGAPGTASQQLGTAPPMPVVDTPSLEPAAPAAHASTGER